ncbi:MULTISPECIES: hypothetical protein [Pseudomonas]|uniref:Uncharacterized protein n=2 Tax=Pseudomonas TaxID=286 RepID=A0AAU8LEW7_PSESX|nr:hypothetical protein [Pseudomonas triticifolii]MBC3954187.1 hypothetical protein [Pseudomonas triticifolii]
MTRSENEAIAKAMAQDAYRQGLARYDDPEDVLKGIGELLYERAVALDVFGSALDEHHFTQCFQGELERLSDK